MAALGRTEPRNRDVPVTTEDLIEEGAANEESGDRWLSTDLAKALRFYQNAYSDYRNAISADNSGFVALQDAYYNALRLLFLVYTQYSKNDSIDVTKLSNVEEVLTGDENSVVQEISAILVAHERSMAVGPGSAPSDLLYNSVLVYTDAIDDTDDAGLVEQYATKGLALVKEVLKVQVDEFHEFLEATDQSTNLQNTDQSMSAGDLPANSRPDSAENTGANPALSTPAYSSDSTPSYTPVTTVQPPDILDTVIAGLGLFQTVLESVGGDVTSLDAAVAFMGPFSAEICTVGDQIVREYFPHSDRAAAIDLDSRNEYMLAKTYVRALSCQLEQIFLLWEHPDLPNTAQRYMLAADCVGTVLERSRTSADPKSAPDVYWAALTKMNNYFKQAQDLLNAEYQEKKAKGMSDSHTGVGELISQISKVYIARADIDLQRSQVENEQGQKNAQLLFNNSKAFLKNAMNLAKVSGGIRETAVERSRRERCRYEAVSRLCLLEGKTSEQELNSIMGSGMWEADMASYGELWYFQKFFPSLQ